MLTAAVVVGVVVAGLVLIGVVVRGRLADASRRQRRVYDKLRDQILGGSARELGIPLREGQRVWGVLMELGYPQAVATVVALRDGNASIYMSSGGGTIGGAGHEAVRAAALHANDVAETQVAAMLPTEDFPGPAVGEVAFYVLTTEGVFTRKTREGLLQNGHDLLSPLYMAGQGVVTQFRLIQEKQAHEAVETQRPEGTP